MKRKNKKYSKNSPLRYKVQLEPSPGGARTLPASNGFFKSTGWTIEGAIVEDYYEWINDFKAFHPKYGRVEGNFEHVVKASSKKAYEQFIKDHPYEEWDYGDI